MRLKQLGVKWIVTHLLTEFGGVAHDNQALPISSLKREAQRLKRGYIEKYRLNTLILRTNWSTILSEECWLTAVMVLSVCSQFLSPCTILSMMSFLMALIRLPPLIKLLRLVHGGLMCVCVFAYDCKLTPTPHDNQPADPDAIRLSDGKQYTSNSVSSLIFPSSPTSKLDRTKSDIYNYQGGAEGESITDS